MKVEYIGHFVEAARLGSISKAAKKRYVTLQGVSKAVRSLENELGHELMVHGRRAVILTPFGCLFLERAERILKQLEELKALSERFDERTVGNRVLRVALCFPSLPGSDSVRRGLEEVAERNIGVPACVSAVPSVQAAVEALARGEVDALMTMGRPSVPGLDCAVVGSMKTGVVIRKAHPLAEQKDVRLADLGAFPAVMSCRLEGCSDSILLLYAKRGLASRRVAVANANALAQVMREDGFVFTALVSRSRSMNSETVVRPIASQDQIAVPVCLVSSRVGKAPSCVAFQRFLCSAVGASILDRGVFAKGEEKGACPAGRGSTQQVGEYPETR
ncbi:MAG TPA: LysR family transcriptional regulator [Candidatus Rubneribacter avistercoris]|nr:LysR family transcriptional regulator [Candidatus Rubneribacter avistercoris]